MPSTSAPGRTRDQIAQQITADLAAGWYVNLGIGLPTLMARHLASRPGVMLHSEHGLLGMGPPPAPGSEDPDLCDAGKNYATLVTGGTAFDSSLSFAMIRGGHIDVAVLGALQVSRAGDLANWHVPGGDPGVGGAMDLAAGAKRVWVAMSHVDKYGKSKIVAECDYPLTGREVVDRIYTDLATFDVEADRLVLRACAPGVDAELVARRTEVPFDVEFADPAPLKNRS